MIQCIAASFLSFAHASCWTDWRGMWGSTEKNKSLFQWHVASNHGAGEEVWEGDTKGEIPVVTSARAVSKGDPWGKPCTETTYEELGLSWAMPALRASPGSVWFCPLAQPSESATSIRKPLKATLPDVSQDTLKLFHSTSDTVRFTTRGSASSGWQNRPEMYLSGGGWLYIYGVLLQNLSAEFLLVFPQENQYDFQQMSSFNCGHFLRQAKVCRSRCPETMHLSNLNIFM